MRNRTGRFLWLVGLIGVVGWGACDTNTADLPQEAEEDVQEPVRTPVHEQVDDQVAFVDVHVIPMDAERVLEHQTVLVENKQIVELGPVDAVVIPDGWSVIEGDGLRFLMPGLADMHVHLNDISAEARKDHIVYVANGITTIREMWSFNNDLTLRESLGVNESNRFGPYMYVAGPGMDGPGGPHNTPAVQTTEQGRALVEEYANKGYDFIKVYNLLAPEVYAAIMEEAAEQGIPVIGHVPTSVGLQQVVAAGQVDIEHFIGYMLAASNNRSATGTLDLNTVNQLAQLTAAAGTWHTPTITVGALSTNQRVDIIRSPHYRYVSPSMRARFSNGFHRGIPPATAERVEANVGIVLRAVQEAGGRLLLGTDAGFGFMQPGFSIHDELVNMVEAGLTPYEALRAGTANAAAFVGASDIFGTITIGSRADLILLDENPLEEVAHVRDARVGVMLRGRWRSAAWFERELEALAASYGQ